MQVNPRDFLPRDKCDSAAVQALIELGYPAITPVLPDLLEWLQDGNWPISKFISEYLATLPEEAIAPLIWQVLQGNDQIWKYWCIVLLISRMVPSAAARFRAELTRLAVQPTPSERVEELNEVARDAISNRWPSDDV